VPTEAEIREAAAKIRRARAKAPDDDPLEVIQRELAKLPGDWKQAVEDCVFAGYEAGMANINAIEARYRRYERWGAGISGAAFIVLLIFIAFYVPDPSDFQYFVFRCVLALAAGGFAGVLPGVLEVNWSKSIRATGAVGVFVIVYFWNPAQLAVQLHMGH